MSRGHRRLRVLRTTKLIDRDQCVGGKFEFLCLLWGTCLMPAVEELLTKARHFHVLARKTSTQSRRNGYSGWARTISRRPAS